MNLTLTETPKTVVFFSRRGPRNSLAASSAADNTKAMSTHDTVDLRDDWGVYDPNQHKTDLTDQQPDVTEDETSLKTGYEDK